MLGRAKNRRAAKSGDRGRVRDSTIGKENMADQGTRDEWSWLKIYWINEEEKAWKLWKLRKRVAE